MIFCGRKVIEAPSDPVPDLFRACLGHIVLGPSEVQAVVRGGPDDEDLINKLQRIALAEDRADARFIYLTIQRTVTRRTPKMSPTNRMHLLRTLTPGRR